MTRKSLRDFLVAMVLTLGASVFGPAPMQLVEAAPAPPTPLAISQVPLTMVAPVHPQVLFAIGNSQSMDGDLSGAIMTGSGVLSTDDASLANSSSPVDYSVPAGFTPPVTGATGATAPYTVLTDGIEYDNSASRLNVAKAAISAIVAAYAQNTQFALEDYSASASSVYTTWVYLMSGAGGFTFSSTDTSPPSGLEYIANPCYQYTAASTTVASNCASLVSAKLYSASTLGSNPYMLVANSSDDADVNDVLYWTGSTAVFDDYGTLSKPNPYPPNFTLADYNSGGVTIGYASVAPTGGVKVVGPTNAGFVPYSPQVFYARRGFGYDATASATTGKIVVPMQTTGSTATEVAAIVKAFQPSLAPETNQSDTSEIKALAVQSPLAGLMQEAKTYMASLPNPGDCTKQYVILISDGLPTEDLSGKSWPPLGSAAAAGYGVTATFNTTTGALTSTNDQALTDTINAITALQQAGINTYVVGMGAGVDPAANPTAAETLKAMAVAGNTGDYFAASSPAAVVSDLNTILISIQSASVSSASLSTNSGGLSANSTLYQASFTDSASPYQDWTGDVDAYQIGAGGSVVSPAAWDAQTQLAAQVAGTGWQTNRNIATWNPTGGSSATGAGAPFQWADLSAAQQADLQQPGDPTVTPSYAQLRVNYLRGDASEEQISGGPFRNRSAFLGDIVDSNPLYVGEPAGPYLDASYQAFEETYETTPRPAVIYVGANDGMLHAFNAATGNEMFAFVPNAVFGNLANLTSPFYNSNHQFFVDGSPSANDVLFGSDGKWHTELVGGEGAGGNSIYALDVTNPQNLTSDSAVAGAVLWEFTDPGMGLSYSQPIIARINANPVVDASSGTTVAGFAVMFGNGYNSASEQPIFYAVKPDSGAIIAKIDLCTAAGVPSSACNASLPNGLSSVVAGNSSGILGYPVNEVYAGDLQGNLWAIDVSNSNPADWTVRLIFQARDSSGNPQPITTAPVITLNPNYPAQQGFMVLFGTGQLLQTADLSNTNTQSFYAVWDSGQTTPATRANLQQQTFTEETASGVPQPVRISSNNTVNWSTQVGWYYDLPLAGERILSSAVVVNGGVIFATYAPTVPSSTTCSAGGQSWLMDVTYTNGGPYNLPQLDVLGNGNLNASLQQVDGQNPTGISLGSGYVPTSAIILAPGQAGGVGMFLFNNGKGTTSSGSTSGGSGSSGGGSGGGGPAGTLGGVYKPTNIGARGNGPSRVGWWQIQ